MKITVNKAHKVALVAIALPIAMLVGFFTVLFRDIGRAFRYAWLEALIELESGKRFWREK